MQIVKKYDSKLKKFVHYCEHKGKKCKFIDSKSDDSFNVQNQTAWSLFNNNCFDKITA